MGKRKVVAGILLNALQDLHNGESAAAVADDTAVALLEWRDAQPKPETRAGKMLRLSGTLRAVVADMDGMGSDVPVFDVADISERYGRYVSADQMLAAIGCALLMEAEKLAAEGMSA